MKIEAHWRGTLRSQLRAQMVSWPGRQYPPSWEGTVRFCGVQLRCGLRGWLDRTGMYLAARP